MFKRLLFLFFVFASAQTLNCLNVDKQESEKEHLSLDEIRFHEYLAERERWKPNADHEARYKMPMRVVSITNSIPHDLMRAIRDDNDIQINNFFADESNKKWLNAQDQDGHTPLMIAAMLNKKKSAQALVKLKADIKAQNNVKVSALLMGIKNCADVELVELLVKNGGDLKAKDKWDKDALANAKMMYESTAFMKNLSSTDKQEALDLMKRYEAIIAFLDKQEKESL